MPYNIALANLIREAIAGAGEINEKTMFRGMCFMVNDKMCICVNQHEIMCRIGPSEYETALEKPGVRTMVNNGRTMKGFVFVSEDAIKLNKDLAYWITSSLAFNATAEASKPKKKK